MDTNQSGNVAGTDQNAKKDADLGTEIPDGSMLVLMGWVYGIVFLILGILCFISRFLAMLGLVFIIVAIISVIRGYRTGAKVKAAAMAYIKEKKAADMG